MWKLVGLLIAGTMLATGGCATTAPPPPTVNVSGNWAGTWWAYEGEGGSGDLRGTFLQEGASVKGEFDISGRVVRATFVSGHVSGNEIRLSIPSAGTLVVAGDEITGTVSGLTATRITLRRVR